MINCKNALNNLEDGFENSHNFIAQVFSGCILFFLLAFNSDLMIFGKKPNKINIFFISIIFSIICIGLSTLYFKTYLHDYMQLKNKCNNEIHKSSAKNFPLRYYVPIAVSFGFILISFSLLYMIISQMI